ncbi:MAG: prephenate dehydratase [Victivallaceae bacterium]|nr:prephenate dehydratase [Victivallaceae bacterium]
MPIDEFRAKIDRLDARIVELLNERSALVMEIGKIKRAEKAPIYVPERERMLLDKLEKLNAGGLLDRDSLLAIYREIMSAAIKLEKPLAIAFLGPNGTFSHQAVIEKFGHGVTLLPQRSIADVFRSVENGRADYGMVPVENTTEGVVNQTLDALMNSGVGIVAEHELPVRLILYGTGRIEDVRCVYSHPQPFGQCREYLTSRLPGASQIEVTSTARAMELAGRDSDSAAIAGKLAGELTPLPVLAENIGDNPRNITRFAVIGTQTGAPSGNDKTSLCFSLHDRSGALYDALRPFRNHDISMTLIESRPLKSGSWEYCFFVDILGHRDDPAVAAACKELESDCAFFKIFGSYPRSL